MYVGPQGVLETSRQTLEELHNVYLPADGLLWAEPSLGLAHFGVLRRLTLCECMPPGVMLLSRLPLSLQSLTLLAEPSLGSAVVSASGCDSVWMLLAEGLHCQPLHTSI